MQLTHVLALASLYLSAVNAGPSRFEANVAKGLRLIQGSKGAAPFWTTEGRKLELLRSGEDFLDVTETYYEAKGQKVQHVLSAVGQASYPPPSQSAFVKSIISTLSIPRMEATLANLTAFNNRYYMSETGVAAGDWLFGHLNSITGGRRGITVSQFDHPWPQKSIIVKFHGTSTNAPVVILGSHFDSINSDNPMSGRGPGADDNGSGTTNLIEVLRALVAADFSPIRPVEFHFYSGEEEGMLGSEAIAKDYRNRGIPVYAMVNFDMTGYFKPGSKEVIALVTDDVDLGLTDCLRSFISAYCSIPAGTDKCGYPCSDHVSWNTQGYPAATPYEAPTEYDNPHVHSPSDTATVEGFSWSHSLEFAKLAAAVAVELGSV